MEDEELEKEVSQDKGIKIGTNYILRADSMNLILEEYGFKVNPRGKTPEEKEPKWGMTNKNYFRTVQLVFNYILDNEVITTGVSELKELKEIVQVVENLRSEFIIFKNCTKLNEDTLSVIV